MSEPTRRSRPAARRCSRSCAAPARLIVVTHEHPDGDALGSLVAMQHVLTALGHDSLMFIAESDLPLPYEYRFLPLDGLSASRRPTSTSARSCSWTAATSSATRRRAPASGRRLGAHPQHRPPPRQHPLRHRQLRRPGRLLHRRDRLGPGARARRRADADDRRRAVRRADHRHRLLHVREHRPARAPDGRRADRGRGRRPRHLPAGLRGRSVRQAGAARARPREHRALRRRPPDRLAAERRGLRGGRAPRRATPRA